MDFEVLTRQIPWAGVGQPAILEKARERFDEADRRVQRRVQRGESIEQQREEWLEDFPLEERRPDIRTAAEAGCSAALIDLTQRCWADAPEMRPTVGQRLTELRHAFAQLEGFASADLSAAAAAAAAGSPRPTSAVSAVPASPSQQQQQQQQLGTLPSMAAPMPSAHAFSPSSSPAGSAAVDAF
eukprot:COSAG05_NODE_3577_length_1983_cov_2.612392_2_plen_183_part_01